jgi:glucoamylase
MHASGHPGIAPTWTSSAKDMVGCALGSARVWFTIGHGILNEVYYPRADIPQIRDLGFVVADGRGFWIEVKRLGSYRISVPAAGIPALQIVHEHRRFRLRIRIAGDPRRDAVVVELGLDGDDGLRPYALLAPHLGGTGSENRAQATTYRGRRILWAEQGPFGLALAAADIRQGDAWRAISAGYVGTSDGWQDFAHNGALTWSYDTAGPGNVALVGELPVRATLALAFGTSQQSAATLAFAALRQPFADVWEQFVGGWRAWHAALDVPSSLPSELRNELATSAMVLRVHQDCTYPGAMVASLSIPWGNTHDDLGGYHLVWPRDLVECAGGLLALGAVRDAANVLRYLIATQQAEGNWSQNQWLGGKAYWLGNQLDETAFPILLSSALADRGALDGIEVRDMVRRALSFIARNGPATEQDRWEEDPGINTFTLAVCVAALVCGAPCLDEPTRTFALELADYWNARIEDWTAVRDTTLARSLGVAGYYVRIAPPPSATRDRGLKQVLPIKNRACDPGLPGEEQVSTDFLQLVRLGLRDPHDPLVVDSLIVIDQQLKTDTPIGPAWHRYTGDGYGEHRDGSAFDGVGIGRAWPLLTGERGHYELAAGRDPLPYLRTMTAMTGRCGLIPEQVWDGEAIPARGLFPGRPTGSAMPLAWAHSEFVKLALSCRQGRPCDRPEPVWKRYGGARPPLERFIWTPRFPVTEMAAGTGLRICVPEPARVRYGLNGWTGVSEVATWDSGLGVHVADLPVAHLRRGDTIEFTFFWSASRRWEGGDYRVTVIRPPS